MPPAKLSQMFCSCFNPGQNLKGEQAGSLPDFTAALLATEIRLSNQAGKLLPVPSVPRTLHRSEVASFVVFHGGHGGLPSKRA